MPSLPHSHTASRDQVACLVGKGFSPVRKQTGPKGIGSRFVARLRLIPEIIAELRKVVWPTRREALHLTVMVLIVAIIVGIILGAVDYGFSQFVDKIFMWGR